MRGSFAVNFDDMKLGIKAILSGFFMLLLAGGALAYLVLKSTHEKLRPKDLHVSLYVVEADNNVVRLPMTDLIVVRSDVFEANFNVSYPPVEREITLANSLVRDSIARIRAASSALVDAEKASDAMRGASVSAAAAVEVYAKPILKAELAHDFEMLCLRLAAQRDMIQRRVARAAVEAESVAAYNDREAVALRGRTVSSLRKVSFPSQDAVVEGLREKHNQWALRVLGPNAYASRESLMRERALLEISSLKGMLDPLYPVLRTGGAFGQGSYFMPRESIYAHERTTAGIEKVMKALAADLGVEEAMSYRDDEWRLVPGSPVLRAQQDPDTQLAHIAKHASARRALHMSSISQLSSASMIDQAVANSLSAAYDKCFGPASSDGTPDDLDRHNLSPADNALSLSEELFSLRTRISNSREWLDGPRRAAAAAKSEIESTSSALASELPASVSRLSQSLYFPTDSRVAQARTDVNGQCQLVVPAGSYYVCAYSPVYGHWAVPQEIRSDSRLELNNTNIRGETVPPGKNLLNVPRSPLAEKLPARFSYMVAISGISSLKDIPVIFEQLGAYEDEVEKLSRRIADK